MQIEEEQPSTKSIESLLENPNNRTKVIKMMLQSMRLMGWHASAKQLSLQSSINSDEQSIQQIKQYLKNFQYSKAASEIEKVDLAILIKTEIQETIQDLHVMHLIKNKNYEEAIQKLGNFTNEKQVKFYTMIGLGFQQINNLQFETKHANIIQKCLKDTVQMSCLHKMLTNYISDDRFINKKIAIKPPPKSRIAKSPVLSNLLGKVTFIKFNKDASLIAVIDDKYREIQLSLWNIVDNTFNKINSARIGTLGFIDAVKWNESISPEKHSLLALCTYRNSNIVIHNTPSLEQVYIISAKSYNIPKILCFQWHPISELLYIGGLFDCSYGFDAAGELVTTITPFIKSREIAFSQEGTMLAISATRGQLIKFCIETQKQINKFVAAYSFMDLKYYPNSNTVIVSNKEHIYLLNANTFHVNTTFDSPLNPKMFKIEIFMFDAWTIVFTGKLSAIVQNDKVTRHANWTDYDAVDVKNNRMVTFKSAIEVWQSRQGQAEQVNELNQQMEINQEGGSDIQVEDFQLASDSGSAVEQSIEQINQQIINLDQNQEQDSEFDDDDL